jgi:hypothetical protein
MKINYSVALIILMLNIISCSPKYVAVYNTKSDLPNDTEQYYRYENDTLIVKYSFWQNKGIMSFSVYNKLNIPLYIDWKKSNYISNLMKFDYWSDQQVTKGKSLASSYFYKGPLSVPYMRLYEGTFNTETVKPERVTFLPPKAIIYKSSYFLTDDDVTSSPKGLGSVSSKERRPDNSKKYFIKYTKSFSKASSPLVFRNFVTYSTQESFAEEKYINDEFYVNEIKYINTKYFKLYKTAKGKEFFVYPYEKGIYFYLER